MTLNEDVNIDGKLTVGDVYVGQSGNAAAASVADKLSEIASALATLNDGVESIRAELDEMRSAVAELKANNDRLATEYNKAIQVINDLSERLAELEKNYDPTVIK